MTPTLGQFEPPTDAVERAIAQQTAAALGYREFDSNTVPQIRTAKIVSSDGGSPPTVTLTWDAGTTNVAGIRYLWPYVPKTDDIVYTLGIDGVQWVVGKIYLAADYEPNRGEGNVTSIGLSSQSVGDSTVIFAKTYSVIPIVTVTVATGSAVDYLVKLLAVSTTQFTVRVRERTNTNVTDTVFIQWTARAWL